MTDFFLQCSTSRDSARCNRWTSSGLAPLRGARRWFPARLFAPVAAVLLLGMASAVAGEAGAPDLKDNAPGLTRGGLDPAAQTPIYQKGQWEFSLESAYIFQTIPNILFVATQGLETNPKHYHLATELLSARYQLYSPCGPSLLRGTLEVSANIVGVGFVHGPEDYFFGFALGFRYYFIQPGARIVPFVELRGGPGTTNSQGGRFEQQQDLTFTYMAVVGLRYDYDRHWSAAVSAMNEHMSDAYLTKVNYGFDGFGVSLSVIRRF